MSISILIFFKKLIYEQQIAVMKLMNNCESLVHITTEQALEIIWLTSAEDKHDKVEYHLAKSDRCYIAHITENIYLCFL